MGFMTRLTMLGPSRNWLAYSSPNAPKSERPSNCGRESVSNALERRLRRDIGQLLSPLPYLSRMTNQRLRGVSVARISLGGNGSREISRKVYQHRNSMTNKGISSIRRCETSYIYYEEDLFDCLPMR